MMIPQGVETCCCKNYQKLSRVNGFLLINQFEDHWPSVSGRTNVCNQTNAGYF
jgi:hypothetical protein